MKFSSFFNKQWEFIFNQDLSCNQRLLMNSTAKEVFYGTGKNAVHICQWN